MVLSLLSLLRLLNQQINRECEINIIKLRAVIQLMHNNLIMIVVGIGKIFKSDDWFTVTN